MAGVRARDVAARAGVSVGSVSNFFNHPELVSSENRERIREAIAALDYVPNDSARQLRGRHPRTIAYLTFEIDSPFAAAVYEGADLRAAELGYTLVAASSRGDVAREAEYLDFFERRRLSGILVSPLGDVRSQLEEIHRRGTAVATIDRSMPDVPFPVVGVDDELGGRLAAQHLAALGFDRIVFVGADSEMDIIARRVRGAQSADGITLEARPVAARTVEGGRAFMEERLSARRGAEAYLAVNDLVALGLFQVMRREGVERDSAVVGFDDLEILHDVVSLSSVRRPSHELGRIAVGALDAAIRDEPAPTPRWLAPQLEVRESSRPARRGTP